MPNFGIVWPLKAVIIVFEGVSPSGAPSGLQLDCGHRRLYVHGYGIPLCSSVDFLHSRGAVTWPDSLCTCSKASVTFSETLFTYKEWKYSCGMSSIWWWNFSTLVSCVNGMKVLPFLLPLVLGLHCMASWLSLWARVTYSYPVIVFVASLTVSSICLAHTSPS